LGTIPLSGQPIWACERAQRRWTGLGAQQLLDQSLTAFFASRQCPGTAIRAAMDWALDQARARQGVISGFHSPLEQSVLHLLLQARSPVVAVLARPVDGARLNPDWKTAIAEGRMAVVSASTETKRLTSEQALQRNELAARLAGRIVIACASTGGSLARQSKAWTS
jgi:predicted Rossmann fold nucleotide-binding protein DprA/Smf involved in DNA uptake